MNDDVNVTGIVLSSQPQGEYDRRIVLLTKERGKISAFANGARRPTSRLLASTNAFSYGSFELYEGRNSFTLKNASIKDHFENLVNDLDEILFASYFSEVTMYYSRENADEKFRLLLILYAFSALQKKQIPLPLLKAIFELKTLSINGEAPNFFSCMDCGSEENLDFFSMKKRGMICKDCASAEDNLIPVPQSLLYAFQFTYATEPSKLFSFLLKPEIEKEYISIVEKYRKAYFYHKFDSESFLPG